MAYDDSWFYEYSREQLDALLDCDSLEIIIHILCYFLVLWTTYNIARIIKYHTAIKKIEEKSQDKWNHT